MSFNQGIPGPATLINSSSTLLYGNSASANALSVQQLGAGNVATFRTTTGATALFVGANGNVGVGTFTPAGPLGLYHVTAGIPATSGSTDSNVATRVQVQNVAIDTGVTTPGVSWIQPRLYTNYATNYGLALCPNGGNVGIGTATVSAGLQYWGGASSTTTNGAPGSGGVIIGSDATNGSPGDYSPVLHFRQSWYTQGQGSVTTGGIAGYKTAASGSFGGGLAFLYCGNGATSLSQGMTLTDAGRVGIGTTSPACTFHMYQSQAGAPATSGSTDANIAHRIHVSSIGVDTGVYGGGYAWIQPRNATNYATNYGITLCPNGGNVGIGTTNPQAALQVNGDFLIGQGAGSYGYNSLAIQYDGHTNYGSIIGKSVKWDGTNYIVQTDGSTPRCCALQMSFDAGFKFVTTSAAGGSNLTLSPAQFLSNTKVAITLGGNVGIGTSAPAAKLGVVVDGFATVTASSWDASWFTVGSTGNSIANAVGLGWQTAANTGVLACVQPTVAWRNMAYTAATHDFYINGSFVASIRNALTGGATTLSVDANGFIIRTPSDERLKTDVQPISYGLDTVNTFRPVSYKWVEPETYGAGRSIGLIAQEVALLVPEAVSAGGDDNKTLSLDYQKLVPVLTKAIQELSAENTVLKTQLASMDARLAALEARA